MSTRSIYQHRAGRYQHRLQLAGRSSTANGYTAGGLPIGTATGSQTSGTFKFVGGTDPSWIASGGSIGPFQYAVLYNSTPATKPLIGWWDYGTALTLTNGNTFAVHLDPTNGILTLT